MIDIKLSAAKYKNSYKNQKDNKWVSFYLRQNQ